MIYTFEELSNIQRVLLSCLDYKGRQFSYAIEKNLAVVDSKLKLARKRLYSGSAFKDAPEMKFNQYLDKLRKLDQKHGQIEGDDFLRDDNGDLIVKDQEAYEEDISRLDSGFPGCAQSLLERRAALDSMRGMEFDVVFRKISIEDILPDDLTTRDRIGLRFMFSFELIPEEVLQDELDDLVGEDVQEEPAIKLAPKVVKKVAPVKKVVKKEPASMKVVKGGSTEKEVLKKDS